MPDPLNDPRVQAARSRVRTVERKRERFAEPTAEVTAPKAATMRIFGRIDADGAPWGVSAQDVADSLDALPEGTERLDVHIHSYGGDAFEGLAILNLLRQSSAEVHVTVDGIAASAASAIAMAGKTITMAPQSTLMIHDAAGLGLGQAADMRILADALDSVSDSYAAAYAAKAGGSPADWRAAMQPESWFRADEAVTAHLADAVLADTPAEPKASATYDLSIFAYAGRDHAPEPLIPTASQTPATTPETPPTEHEEADAMSDTLLDGLRKQLGLADDADEATVLAANAEALTEKAEPPAAEPTTTDADTVAAVVASLEANGKKVVSANVLDELRDMAQAGVQARAKQLAEERDEAIAAAFAAGKISADRRAAWTASWDKDPEGTKSDLESLPVRFPAGDAPGYAGSTDTMTAGLTKDDADFMAGLGFTIDSDKEAHA